MREIPLARHALWLACAVLVAGLGVALLAPHARAAAPNAAFTLQLRGTVVASQLDASDPHQRIVTQSLLLRPTANQQPAISLALDLTETLGETAAGTLTGTATLADVASQTPLFTAMVIGTVRADGVVLYHLIHPQAATGHGGLLVWQGAIRAGTFGDLTGTASGELTLPVGVATAVVASVWPHGDASATSDPTLWFITRGAASAAYVVLTVVTALGLAIGTRAFDSVMQRWRVLDLHQVLTLALVGLILLHLGTLAFDPYLPFGIVHLIWPVGELYNPLPVALGVIALYTLVLVVVSSWVRPQLPYRVWRAIHYLSFVAFIVLTLHGILTGTDTLTVPLLATYVTSILLVSALTILRVTQALGKR